MLNPLKEKKPNKIEPFLQQFLLYFLQVVTRINKRNTLRVTVEGALLARGALPGNGAKRLCVAPMVSTTLLIINPRRRATTS